MADFGSTARILRVAPSEYGTGSAGEAARDIETARIFYADLLAFAARMDAAGEAMRNRGRWLEAMGRLHQAEALIEQFIGERITADLRARLAAPAVAAAQE